jgi:hypothetical protein
MQYTSKRILHLFRRVSSVSRFEPLSFLAARAQQGKGPGFSGNRHEQTPLYFLFWLEIRDHRHLTMAANSSEIRDSVVASVQASLFGKIAEKTKDKQWARSYASLVNHGATPLEIALACQADLSTILLFSETPVTSYTVKVAFDFRADTRVLSFLAERMPVGEYRDCFVEACWHDNDIEPGFLVQLAVKLLASEVDAKVFEAACEAARRSKFDPAYVDNLVSLAAHSVSKESSLSCLYIACKYGVKAGIISYLVKKSEDVTTHDYSAKSIVQRDIDRNCPVSLAMKARADESDIRALVERWPESLAKGLKVDIHFSRSCCNHLLQEFSREGYYSDDLLEFLAETFPKNAKGSYVFAMCQNCTLGLGDLKWIGKLLKKDSLLLQWAQRSKLKWTGPGLHELLALLFVKDNHLSKLQIRLPDLESEDFFVRRFQSISRSELTKSLEPCQSISPVWAKSLEEQIWNIQSISEFTKSLAQRKSKTQIEALDIELPDPVYFSLLGLIQWPKLHELKVDFGEHLESAMTSLCWLLDHGRLTDLKVKASEAAMKSKKRKDVAGDVVLPLAPLFDSLAKNSNLVELTICDIDKYQWGLYDENLLKTLEQNVTLMTIRAFSVGQRSYEPCKPWGRVRYLRDLNRCGRKIARSASTTLEEFVDLMSSVRENLSEYSYDVDEIDDDVVGIHYGLLHEAIDLWAK